MGQLKGQLFEQLDATGMRAITSWYLEQEGERFKDFNSKPPSAVTNVAYSVVLSGCTKEYNPKCILRCIKSIAYVQ